MMVNCKLRSKRRLLVSKEKKYKFTFEIIDGDDFYYEVATDSIDGFLARVSKCGLVVEEDKEFYPPHVISRITWKDA